MPLTLSDLLKRVRFYVDDGSADADLYKDADRANEVGLISLVGDSIRELEAVMRQTHENYFLTSTTLNTTDGTSTVSLPNDFVNLVRLERVKDEGGSTLDAPIPLDPLSSFYDQYKYEAEGTPRAFFILASTILLVPTPDLTVTGLLKIWYTKRITLPSALTDTTDIPDDYIEAVSVSAAIRAKLKTNADPTLLLNHKDRLMENIRKDLETRQNQEPRYVRFVPRETSLQRVRW